MSAVAMLQGAEKSPQPAIKAAPAFTAAQLSAAPTSGWLTNRGNVAQLKASLRTHLNAMPAFRGTLTLEQLRDVAHYVSKGLFNTGRAD